MDRVARPLSSRFQDAAVDPSLWLDALQQLADSTGSARAELVFAGPSPDTSFSWVTSADERMYADFEASGGHDPQSNFRIAADDGKSVLSLMDETDFEAARRRLSNTDFVDFTEQHGMVHGCQTVLVRDAETLVGLSLLRTREDGMTSERDKAVFCEAASAAASAVRLQRAIEEQGHLIVAGTFESMTIPSLLLDGFGRVRAVTPAAERFLGDNGFLTLRDLRLSSDDRQLAARLDKAIAAVLGPAMSPRERLLVKGRGCDRELIEIFRLEPREWTMSFGPQAVVVIRSPGQLPPDSAAILADVFGLTRAEAEVAALLCQGIPREEILRRRAVSSETLRSQLRALYSKTDCSREAEFVILARVALQ